MAACTYCICFSCFSVERDMQIIIDSETKALERKENSHVSLRHCISRSLNELKGKHDKNLEFATFI